MVDEIDEIEDLFKNIMIEENIENLLADVAPDVVGPQRITPASVPQIVAAARQAQLQLDSSVKINKPNKLVKRLVELKLEDDVYILLRDFAAKAKKSMSDIASVFFNSAYSKDETGCCKSTGTSSPVFSKPCLDKLEKYAKNKKITQHQAIEDLVNKFVFADNVKPVVLSVPKDILSDKLKLKDWLDKRVEFLVDKL